LDKTVRFFGARALWPGRSGTWAVALAVVAVVATVVLAGIGAQKKQVVLMGDSLMAESSAAVADYLDFQGYTVQPSTLAGSGLLDTEVDWLAHGRSLIAQYDPSVVVVEFTGDYGFLGTRPGIVPFTASFYYAWAQAAQQLEDILTSRGATVYWVVGPVVANPTNNESITTLDKIYAHLRAPNSPSGHPSLIDVTPALTGGTGKFTEFLARPGGQPMQVRQPDGTHFTIYGVALFARAIAEAIA